MEMELKELLLKAQAENARLEKELAERNSRLADLSRRFQDAVEHGAKELATLKDALQTRIAELVTLKDALRRVRYIAFQRTHDASCGFYKTLMKCTCGYEETLARIEAALKMEKT